MEKAFDFLAKRGLGNDQQIESAIMHKWDFTDIIDFALNLNELIDVHPEGSTEVTSFNFLANSNLSAQAYGGCGTWGCRLERIDRLARFAALYSDRIYITNYLDEFTTHKLERLEGLESNIRYDLAGHIKVLLTLRPLLESGIVCLINHPGAHLCPACIEKIYPSLEGTIDKLEQAFAVLTDRFADEASFRLLSYSPTAPSCAVHIKGSEDFVEHGAMGFSLYTPPKWLVQKAKSIEERGLRGGVHLSKKVLLDSKIPQSFLSPIKFDVFLQLFCSRALGINAKYLANSAADVSLLCSLTDDKDFKQFDEVSQKDLVHYLPIIQDVPLKYLLKVRSTEHDAFLAYRNTINHIIKEYVVQRKHISNVDSRQIYEDIIYPKLCDLDAKVNSIKRKARKQLVQDVTIGTAAVVVGVFSGIVPSELKLILGSLASVPAARELWELSTKLVGTPDEIRSDNFYYLWKLARKAPRKIRYNKIRKSLY